MSSLSYLNLRQENTFLKAHVCRNVKITTLEAPIKLHYKHTDFGSIQLSVLSADGGKLCATETSMFLF